MANRLTQAEYDALSPEEQDTYLRSIFESLPGDGGPLDILTVPGDVAGDISGIVEDPTGAKEAGRRQEDAIDKAMGVTREMYETSREDLAPYTQAGYGAMDPYMQELGIGVDPYRQYVKGEGEITPEKRALIDKRREAQGLEPLGPPSRPGVPTDFEYEEFAFEPWDIEKDPGYQFALEEGLRGLQHAQSARGGRSAPRSDREAMRYATGLAGQHAQESYGRHAMDRGFARGAYDADRGFAYAQPWDVYNAQLGQYGDYMNRLGGLVGSGQAAAAGQAGQGMQYGQQMSNMYGQQGNIQAQSAMQPWNTWMNILNTGANAASAAYPWFSGGK
jgi:hypothetical protein